MGKTRQETAPAKKRGRGRESQYTPKMGVLICELIAQKYSLKRAMEKLYKDGKTTIKYWQTAEYWIARHEDFAMMYARAREARADFRSQTIDEYVQDVREGKLDANAARVMIDAEKWQASKENPRRYGDKLTLEGDMTMRLSDNALDDRLARLASKGVPALTHDARDRDDH